MAVLVTATANIIYPAGGFPTLALPKSTLHTPALNNWQINNLKMDLNLDPLQFEMQTLTRW